MSACIYYFSGTGNSLCVARDIAERLGGNLISIASMEKYEIIRPDSEVIGLVFPVYYGELPLIIKRFAEKLTDIENKYIFVLSTFGGSTGYSLKLLRPIIQSRGGKIAATYRVHMPQNSFYKWWERHDILLKTWKTRQLSKVVENTNKRKKGEFFKHFWLAPLFIPTDYIVHRMKPSYRQSFIKLSNASPQLDTDELILLNDTSFSVNDKCTGCGTCSRVCPVNNIKLSDGKPVWQHACENCLACYNWCPTRAIEGGIAHQGYYYRHPDIKLNEIMQQRSSIA
jgi:ferredoxin/flavodoxin